MAIKQKDYVVVPRELLRRIVAEKAPEDIEAAEAILANDPKFFIEELSERQAQ